MPPPNLPTEIIANVTPALARTFLDRLVTLFIEMDRAYERAARHYGFECRGCEDNCCNTLFYHHTAAEFLYLQAGLAHLDRVTRYAVIARAREYDRATTAALQAHNTARHLCPLNVAQRCILYQHRPMVCRMHGIAYDLTSPAARPENNKIRAPGCDAFTARCGHKTYFELDRTPFYRELATLERELRHAIGFNHKVKMTVARILLEIDRQA